jgi:hypothetical protein
MIQEPFFSILVGAAPTVQDTAVTTPVVSSHVAIMNEKEESIVQDPIEPIIAQEEELQQKCQLMKAPEGLKELENQLSLKTTKSMLAKKFKWKVIPSHLKKS